MNSVRRLGAGTGVLRSRFFWRIYLTFSLLFLFLTLLLSWVLVERVEQTLVESIRDGLRAKIALIEPLAENVFMDRMTTDIQPLLAKLGRETGMRITLIEAGGRVIADSEQDPQTMASHWDRPEVRQALEGYYGQSERHSTTVKQRMYYMAKAVQPGGTLTGFVRVALPLTEIRSGILDIRFTIAFIALLVILVAMAIGWLLARKVSLPIGEMMEVAEAMRCGNYERRVLYTGDDELGRLADTLNRLGDELTTKIGELRHLETVRRDFVANVSHEIKTPLTSIQGYVETLMNGAINDADYSMRFLKKIDRNTARLSALVQDILSLARVEAQEKGLALMPISWEPVITTVLSQYEDALQAKNFKVEIHDKGQVSKVFGDRESMTQVLNNLVGNAIKYTPEGGHLSIRVREVDKGWVALEVGDDGIGIPTAYQERIFERFYRVDTARSRDLGGTGLGLSIVKHLVSSMHGEVRVDSTVGHGSTFTVLLRKST